MKSFSKQGGGAFDLDAAGWPVCCGQTIGVDFSADPPEGVCETCGNRWEIEGEVETTEITIADLLGDAAQVLRDTGKPSLAKAVTIARGMLDEERGETWLRDVLKVLSEAEGVIQAGRDSMASGEPVILDDLARALDACSTWGLNPQQRARNALFETQSALALVLTIISSGDSDRAKLAQIKNAVEHLTAGLGFGLKEGEEE